MHTRRTALAAATATALVVLAGGAAVAANSGVFTNDDNEPAGQLAPGDPDGDGVTTVVVETELTSTAPATEQFRSEGTPEDNSQVPDFRGEGTPEDNGVNDDDAGLRDRDRDQEHEYNDEDHDEDHDRDLDREREGYDDDD